MFHISIKVNRENEILALRQHTQLLPPASPPSQGSAQSADSPVGIGHIRSRSSVIITPLRGNHATVGIVPLRPTSVPSTTASGSTSETEISKFFPLPFLLHKLLVLYTGR